MLGSPLPDSKFWVACVRLSSSSSPTSPLKALEVPENARTSGDARRFLLELSDGFRTSAVRSGIAARVIPIVACHATVEHCGERGNAERSGAT